MAATSVPSFISKGAEVLNATLRDLSRYKTLDVELTPQLLRSVKFNELTGEDEAMISHIRRTLVNSHMQSKQTVGSLTAHETILELSALAISTQCWTRKRLETSQDTTAQRCPHLCPSLRHHDSTSPRPWERSPTILQSRVRDGPLGQPSKPLSTQRESDVLSAILLRFKLLLRHCTQLQKLRHQRAALVQENLQLLHRIVADESKLTLRLQQNVVDGALFATKSTTNIHKGTRNRQESDHDDALYILREEVHALSEVVQTMEQDQQDEESFWRWITTTNNATTEASSNTSSASKTNPWSAPLLEIHRALATVDHQVADILQQDHNRRSSASSIDNEGSLLASVVTDVCCAFESLLQQLASQKQHEEELLRQQISLDTNTSNTRSVDKMASKTESFSKKEIEDQAVGEEFDGEKEHEADDEIEDLRHRWKEIAEEVVQCVNSSAQSPFVVVMGR